MSYKIGTVAYGTTGLKTINLGATSTPFDAMFVVQNASGVNEGTMKHISMGTADAATQRCTSYLKDGALNHTVDSTTKCVSVWENVAGVATEVLAASFDSFTSNGLKLNVTIANSGYSIYIRADY